MTDTTRVLLVGGGAREHAMARAIARSDGAELVAYSRNENPGIARLVAAYGRGPETNVEKVASFAKAQAADLAVVGPEAPLEAGVTEALEGGGVRVASPSRQAARIETDKAFMRRLMETHRVPGRVAHRTVATLDEAREALADLGGAVAVKPVGLTGGKGVKVTGDHLQDEEEVLAYVDQVLTEEIGGEARVVLEEKLEGEEFTLQCFCDGSQVVPMPAVQDHKRLLEGDEGPNTGGMGAYSDADHRLPFLPQEAYDEATYVVQKLVTALEQAGHPYRGVIYGQFMLTAEGPRVVEVNARFGDPEAMNVLPLLTSDYVALLKAMVDGTLGRARAAFRSEATVVKYAVPSGYATGGEIASGRPVEVDEEAIADAGAELFYASVDHGDDGRVLTTTSRALAVLGRGPTIADAEEVAEAGLAHVEGDLHVRHDIGKPALLDARVAHMEALRGTGGSDA